MKLDETNYGDIAEKVILDLKKEVNKSGKPIPIVTTSKIRNLLAMTADIQNDVRGWKSEKLNSEILGRINYLKIRFAYEAGRDPGVKRLIDKADILEHLSEVKNNKQQYLLFSRYMEALVAYRKFYGGRDE
ncbi:MAG: type III-A CRISPR-associated protein Csm2 [Lachnospiraceae bacterium]|nr:type III-A CRISPR-associated protein Csm2 [Lachnospiraceae bacterium]